MQFMKKLKKLSDMMQTNVVYHKSSENMSEIDSETVSLIVTSPPYNIGIKYGNKHKNGKVIESKGVKYQDNLSEEDYKILLKKIFEECKRVLKKDGSVWINIKSRFINDQLVPPFWIMDFFKDMYLKNLIIWNFDWGGATPKRFSPRYEFVFWFTKNKSDYKFNLDDIKIPALNYRPDRFKTQEKNPSDVWYIQMVSGNYPERTSHPAQYPEELIERIIKVGSNKGDLILDPFMGSGTTARVTKDLERQYIGYETNKDYINICNERLKQPIQRKKKRTGDIRPLYMYGSEDEIIEYSKMRR
jgi:DNA modification methylase